MQVIVSETSGSLRSSTLALSISILDANDNAPVFPAAAYQASFPQGTYSSNTFGSQPRNVVTVTATDADSSDNFKRIQYSITDVSNNGLSLFRIDQTTGLIRADGTFTPTLYTITVMATDGERYVHKVLTLYSINTCFYI